MGVRGARARAGDLGCGAHRDFCGLPPRFFSARSSHVFFHTAAAYLPAAGAEGGAASSSLGDGTDPLKWVFENEHIIGNGSFGVVYQAVVRQTQKEVAIKKVLQDKRFKNRELQIMRMLDHTNVTTVRRADAPLPRAPPLSLYLRSGETPLSRATRVHAHGR